MLKKLLKYDFKAIFKFWWIAVVVNFALSIVGGFIQQIDNYNEKLAEMLYDLLGLSQFLVNCSYVALIIVTLVLIFIRFYQNFFTDEGYLTFTLPVTRSQLLNSKLIAGVGTLLASVVICVINLAIMNTIGWWPDLVAGDFQQAIAAITESINTLGIYFWIYCLEVPVLVVACAVLVVTTLYFCITFGSMIVKKGKLIVSIVLCYFISNIVVSAGFFGMIYWFLGFSVFASLGTTTNQPAVTALVLLGLIFYGGALSGLLYSLQYGMLDKKLNLS